MFVHYSEPSEVTSAGHKYKVLLHESKWVRLDRSDMEANREHMMMLLANIEYILIKAAHSEQTTAAGISGISLDTAHERNTGQGEASAVEQCQCPPGYQGLSCESCSPGYYRSPGLYLGYCQQCQCNGKSTSCDPTNGKCLVCHLYFLYHAVIVNDILILC